MTDPFTVREVVRVLVENRARFLAFLQRRTGSREAAEEILQVAFVRSIEKGDSLREDESAVAWCLRLLRNALIDRHRRSGAEQRAMSRHAQNGEHETVEADDAELTSEVCTCMHSLMPTLKPEYADVLCRIDLEGAPTDGVAKEIGISPTTPPCACIARDRPCPSGWKSAAARARPMAA